MKKCACPTLIVPRSARIDASESVYDLTMWTYVLAFGHFTSEFLIFRTAGLGPGLLSPMIVSSTFFS